MTVHWSDCAVHREPAYPVGKCVCGGLELTENMDHILVTSLVSRTRGQRLFIQNGDADRLIKQQQLPTDALVMDTTAANLPDAHYGITLCACPYCMDFNHAGEAVVADFKATA